MFCQSLLACRVSAERSAVNLMGIPLYVVCCFSLAAFNIFCSYLIFDSLINIGLACFSLDLSFLGLSVLPGLDWLFPSHIREIFSYNLFKYFLNLFLFLFFFWDPCNSNIGSFNVVPEVSETVLNSFHSFSLFCSVEIGRAHV